MFSYFDDSWLFFRGKLSQCGNLLHSLNFRFVSWTGYIRCGQLTWQQSTRMRVNQLTPNFRGILLLCAITMFISSVGYVVVVVGCHRITCYAVTTSCVLQQAQYSTRNCTTWLSQAVESSSKYINSTVFVLFLFLFLRM